MTESQLSLLGEDWPEQPRRPARRCTPPAPDAEQLSFDWTLPVALGPEDFFVSESNAAAHAMLAGGLRWPEGRLALVGPEGSGKTHLVRIWQGLTGAIRIDAKELVGTLALPRPAAAVAIDGMESLSVSAEESLFHLHNHLGQTGGRLLLASDRPPARWPIRLPDLRNRMQAVHVVRIDPPDDALLHALLAKQFADRGLFPTPDVLAYLARRIERSHAAAARAVAAIDRASLSEGRRVSMMLARRIVDSEDGSGP